MDLGRAATLSITSARFPLGTPITFAQSMILRVVMASARQDPCALFALSTVLIHMLLIMSSQPQHIDQQQVAGFALSLILLIRTINTFLTPRYLP